MQRIVHATRRAMFAALATVALATVMPAQTPSPTEPPFPPPGRLVDVGGWKLHINCTGTPSTTQPTVILEAGVGDFSVEWSLVQPSVARVARVCSYDRAGDGWSELGPHPRTFQQIVSELHQLLGAAGERPPFALVGHSYGGWLVRLYQQTYPAEVAGMVLVDAGADDPLRMTPNGTVVRSSELPAGRTIPPVKTSGPLREADIPPAALEQMRAGLATASLHANDPPRDRLPPDAQRMRTWALGRLGHVAAAVNPVELEELAALRAARAARPQPLGDIPLVVLTRGLPESDEAQASFDAHRRDHQMIAAMSSRGSLVVATRSGHHIQIDEPELVARAIQQVVTAARR
jgi:pimeloyl-ACP methyl ester carboxylesterase